MSRSTGCGDQRLQHFEPELAPHHRRGRHDLHRQLVEPREPPRDHHLDAFGHAELAAAQQLLDEERIAVGVRMQTSDGLVADARALAGEHERLGLLRVQADERDLLHRRLAAQPREQVEQLVAELLGVAHRRRPRAASPGPGPAACARAAAWWRRPPTGGRRGSAPPSARARRTPAAASRPRTAGSGRLPARPGSAPASGACRRSAGMKRPSSARSGSSSGGKYSVCRCATRCWMAVMNGW